MSHAACRLPKVSSLLQIIAFCDLRFRRFPPIYFVRHENKDSRQNHEFTTVFTSLLRVCRDRIDLVITVNTSSRSQRNSAYDFCILQGSAATVLR